MSTLVVGTTVPPFKSTSNEATRWLDNAEKMVADSLNRFDNVKLFAAIEFDGRGMGVHEELVNRLDSLNGVAAEATYWTFSIDDRVESIDGLNRLFRICYGRNAVCEYAMRDGDVSHVMFLDSDLLVPHNSVSMLMEVFDHFPDVYVAGGDVPSYCLAGPVVDAPFPLQAHWNTAGFLLVKRCVLDRIRWRTSHYPGGHGLSDDPCFAQDVRECGFGETHVRKDLIAIHTPLVPLERRGHDLKVRR